MLRECICMLLSLLVCVDFAALTPLAVAFRAIGREDPSQPLFACVGLRSQNEEVEVNLGASPFEFDIKAYRAVC
jgi:hypothetical protein